MSDKNHVISAGIIPFRERVNDDGTKELEFFVGRPWQTAEYVGFLKGGQEEGETIDETAVREFREESGLTLEESKSSMLIPLGSVKQNTHKTVYAYGLHYPDIDPDKCFSNLCPDGKPEIVKYEWLTYDNLKDRTSKAHLWFYQKLIEIYEKER